MTCKQTRKVVGGFTLIELMIVVVIVGVLASIAVPTYLRMQLKSKTSEAHAQLGHIRTLAQTFFLQHGRWALAAATPAGAPDTNTHPWVTAPNSGFVTIGLNIKGAVRYLYGIGTTITTAGATIYAVDTYFDGSGVLQNAVNSTPSTDVYFVATGDLDGDTSLASFYLTDESNQLVPIPSVAGESIF